MQNQKETESPTTIEQLNDDCLECIFLRLKLPSQLQAARVCRRFRDIINGRIWSRDPNYRTLWLEDWRDVLPQHEDLQYFLHAVRDRLRQIQIADECLSAFLKDLEDLEVTHLPNVERCQLPEILHCCPSDDDIQKLTNLLPNLRYLRLTAPISGRHLADFRMLEELDLYDYEEKECEIGNEFLQEICMNLHNLRVLDIRSYECSELRLTNIGHCQKLEVLKLNLNTLKTALGEVLQLPNLKTLTVLLDNVIDVKSILNVDTHDYKIYELAEFYEILAVKSDRIVGIAVDNYYMPLTEVWDDNLEFMKRAKLQKFAFCNGDFESDILEKYACMTQLKLLCCRNWPRLTNSTILQFVELCPQLEHLDVSYCRRIDKTLLYDILEIEQRQNRSNRLHIYCQRSGIEQEVEEVNSNFWRAQDLVQIHTNEFPPNSEWGLSYVDRGFEFDFE